MQVRILVAEDDADIRQVLKLYLEREMFDVVLAPDGEAAIEIMREQEISLALVDLMMPKVDGLELIQKIRSYSNIPLIILSAKNMEQDKLLGLTVGADLYMTKPFNPVELIANVKAMLRRFYRLGGAESRSDILRIGELELDQQSYTLKKAGEPVSLTPIEMKILTAMMKTPGRVLTKKQLSRYISGDGEYDHMDNTIMVHIANIRSKLEEDPSNPVYIKTIRGLGYKIEKIQMDKE